MIDRDNFSNKITIHLYVGYRKFSFGKEDHKSSNLILRIHQISGYMALL